MLRISLIISLIPITCMHSHNANIDFRQSLIEFKKHFNFNTEVLRCRTLAAIPLQDCFNNNKMKNCCVYH